MRKIAVFAHNPEQEEAKEEIEESSEGSDLEMGSNVNYLLVRPTHSKGAEKLLASKRAG
jgi:DNA polymerase III sliding clamp (beta) subunit (PCNA family)